MRASVAITVLLFGCGGHELAASDNSLIRIDSEPPGANCVDGGVAIHTGIDTNANGILDDNEITATQYVCNGVQPVTCSPGTVVTGTITIEQDSDWAQLDGATCIDGDLLIAGVPDDTLPALTLQTVTGGVVIVGNQELTNIDGLGALRELGGTYLIQGNPMLGNVHGLSSIARASQISIVGNDALPDLSGLEQLTDSHIQLTISNNGSLASLTGLDNLVTANAQITIHSNHDLTSLAGLGSLRSVVLLEISGNESLPAVELPALTQINTRLLVNNNVAVTSVTMPAATTIGDFMQIDGNAALTTVALPELLSVASVLVDSDTSLAAFAAPKLLFATTLVTLFGLPNLTQLDLGSLASIGSTLTINNVPALTNLDAFSKVTTIGGGFTLQNNSGLHDFTGLDALGLVSGDMTVQANAVLSSFAGLGGLQEIGGALKITGNPMLPPATSQAFAHGVTVRGTITIN